jgi:hypothetical protein
VCSRLVGSSSINCAFASIKQIWTNNKKVTHERRDLIC